MPRGRRPRSTAAADQAVKVRLTQDEYALLSARAREAGYLRPPPRKGEPSEPAVGAWLRSLGLAAE